MLHPGPGCSGPGQPPRSDHARMDGQIARELHITVDHNSPVNVDQVLVPSVDRRLPHLQHVREHRSGERHRRRTSPRWTCSPRTRTGFDGPDRFWTSTTSSCASRITAGCPERALRPGDFGSPVWPRTGRSSRRSSPLWACRRSAAEHATRWASATRSTSGTRLRRSMAIAPSPRSPIPTRSAGASRRSCGSTRVRTRASSIRTASTTWTPRTRAGRGCSPIRSDPRVQAVRRQHGLVAVQQQRPGHPVAPDHVHGAGRLAAVLDAASVAGLARFEAQDRDDRLRVPADWNKQWQDY